eukprot:scaffold127607_cov66-Phaeocystis_antarctica.AAC.2
MCVTRVNTSALFSEFSDQVRGVFRLSSPNLKGQREPRSPRGWRRCMAGGILEAVRELWLADSELGTKPLLAKLREQQPDLGAGNKEVREALTALKAESEAKEAAAAAPPAAAPAPAAAAPPAASEGGAPPNASLAPSLACFGCARLPSEMGDGREKHD